MLDVEGRRLRERGGRRMAIVAAVIAGSAAMSLSVPASAASDDHRAVLRRDVDAVRAAGVTGVVAEAEGAGGRVTVRSGVADVTTGHPMPRHGYLRIGSTTKTFVATVILQLAGEGRLSPADTVDRWLPGVVAGHGNDGRRITVRQLLQHTSGLYDYSADLFADFDTAAKYRRNRSRTYAPERLVALALRHKPDFAPGTAFSYSNTNYVLAGMLIQKVTGRSWQREVRDRILLPLGMRHTFTPDVTTSLPTPHARLYQQFTAHGRLVDVTAPVLAIEMGADGSIISTTSDLNRFFRALLGGRLLPADQLRQMEKTVLDTDSQQIVPGARYGLGLEWYPLTCGGGYWNHGGDGVGYDTENGVTSDGRQSVVVSMASRSFDEDSVIAQVKAANRVVADQMCPAG